MLDKLSEKERAHFAGQIRDMLGEIDSWNEDYPEEPLSDADLTSFIMDTIETLRLEARTTKSELEAWAEAHGWRHEDENAREPGDA